VIAYNRFVSRLAIHNVLPSNARPSGLGAGEGRRNSSEIVLVVSIIEELSRAAGAVL
jgi:hypothetical protein